MVLIQVFGSLSLTLPAGGMFGAAAERSVLSDSGGFSGAAGERVAVLWPQVQPA